EIPVHGPPLRDVADLLALFAVRTAENRHGPGDRAHEPENRLEKGRLAGPVRADDGHEDSLGDGQVDVPQDGLVAVRDGQVLDLDDGGVDWWTRWGLSVIGNGTSHRQAHVNDSTPNPRAPAPSRPRCGGPFRRTSRPASPARRGRPSRAGPRRREPGNPCTSTARPPAPPSFPC